MKSNGMTAQLQNGKAVIDQALEWIDRLRSGDGGGEAFFDWLTESPRHVEVFVQAATLEGRLAAIAPKEWATVETAAESPIASLDPPNVVPLLDTHTPMTSATPAPPSARRRTRLKWQVGAMAAGIAALVIAGWQLAPWLSGWRNFTTAVGEQRTIQLQDGSVVNLNTGTRIAVRMTERARDIRLAAGEAMFKVQRDPARPFRVHARDTVIQAVGTQFTVYRRNSGTTVSVLEGRVRVAPIEEVGQKAGGAVDENPRAVRSESPAALSAGEQAAFGPDGRLQWRAKLNTVRATAWQQRRLIFDEEPLSTIVFEFNRYNRRPFRVADADAAARRFSGIFDADDPDSLAQLLARDRQLAVERGPREIIIRKK